MPNSIISVFIELGMDVVWLVSLSAVLFSLIRGGTAVLKIASRFFNSAGA